ncbi:MAG: hypothetical protein LBE74_05765 [Treponema sp.]|nr:hypothetical protein [Treponema sp.]
MKLLKSSVNSLAKSKTLYYAILIPCSKTTMPYNVYAHHLPILNNRLLHAAGFGGVASKPYC